MKHLILLSLFTFHSALFTLSASAALPLKWTVETSRATPATFEAYQGETLALEAALQSYGKPLEAPSNYSLYWQTNGMGSTYWSVPCTQPNSNTLNSNNSNTLYATWSPTNDVGARIYNCFIGQPGTIYHAAFQLRLRPSPGATPNELPLPQKVIDFAKVTVLNPPWSGGGGGGGVDTNAVIDIVREQLETNGIRSVDGAARPLPKYLHLLSFDDSYPDAAAEYYVKRGSGVPAASCSSVRSGGFIYRNFDYPFDDRAEFVVKMSSGTVPSASSPTGASTHRFASVGVAQVGTNLTESFVTSGKTSRWYKSLPGATVDGVNENGVACNINVVSGDPQWGGGVSPALHPLAAVRWILDHATNAQHAATYIASHIAFPSGWTQNFHYMVCDATSTYIVENGTNYLVDAASSPRVVMTNFRLFPTRDTTGEGQERYDALAAGENITNAWYTNAYRRETNPPWLSDLHEVIAYTNDIFDAWAAHPKEHFRNSSLIPHTSSLTWWQSVHTSVYDITNRTLRVAVQETDDWYTFAVPSAGCVKPEAVREIVRPMIGSATNGLRRVDDMAVYDTSFAWIHGAIPDGYELYPQPYYSGITPEGPVWIWAVKNRPGSFRAIGPEDAVSLLFENPYDPLVGSFTAIRERIRITSDTLATSNGVNAAITAHHDEKKRDLTDNTCRKTEWTEWTFSGEDYDPTQHYSISISPSNDQFAYVLNGSAPAKYLPTDSETVVDFSTGDVRPYTLRLTATRSTVCTDGKKFVTDDVVDGKVSAAVSTNNPEFVSAVRSIMPTTLRAYDPVRQCWWNIQPVNGVLTLTVED